MTESLSSLIVQQFLCNGLPKRLSDEIQIISFIKRKYSKIKYKIVKFEKTFTLKKIPGRLMMIVCGNTTSMSIMSMSSMSIIKL